MNASGLILRTWVSQDERNLPSRMLFRLLPHSIASVFKAKVINCGMSTLAGKRTHTHTHSFFARVKMY